MNSCLPPVFVENGSVTKGEITTNDSANFNKKLLKFPGCQVRLFRNTGKIKWVSFSCVCQIIETKIISGKVDQNVILLASRFVDCFCGHDKTVGVGIRVF